MMGELWQGIAGDSLPTALSSFFPEYAYVRLKAVGEPASDWHTRLVGEFRLDIAAAHTLLGAGAARASLISVHVPSGYAHWVEPGTCYNGLGYYEVPNARIVYRQDGVLRSLGIASMISWRGVWYVVHLGGVTRTGEGGMVDSPEPGAGTSAYSSTC